ncbi:phosphotransferase [Paenibacillus sp. N4]|uniref:phosphotransferase n=1 Tax=Paenibacillus vietnamensis TaxID=2590547 RepID=UPI001CD05524|nr:phosphotransferase [Paenibacillus vietnamensis]MCA0755080.1 phosphotransferase [Paenibacillus vietnamensis]
MNLEEQVRMIPSFLNKTVKFEQLNGGLSNETYKLTCEGKCYVLRVFGQQTDYLNFSRNSEIEVMQSFHKVIHSPSVLYVDPNKTYVLLEYIEGKSLTGEDLRDAALIKRIIERLKNIHDSVDISAEASRPCTPYQLVESYLRGAEKLQVKQPEGLTQVLIQMEQINYRRSLDKKYNQRFCHNDYYLCNLLWSPPRKELYVLDWELCGVGDIFFDLAAIPFTNRFTVQQEKNWLQLYFGYYEEEQYAILQDMKYMNMLRECSWGLLHSGLAMKQVNNSFDYYKHAKHVIERLLQGFNQF